VMISPRQELAVASRGGGHGCLGDHRAADCLDDRGGVGVLVGVDPMTSSTRSASIAMR
jgi:hypothetical protein